MRHVVYTLRLILLLAEPETVDLATILKNGSISIVKESKTANKKHKNTKLIEIKLVATLVAKNLYMACYVYTKFDFSTRRT